MAVLGHNITASPEDLVAHEMREDQSLNYSKFSQDDLNGFIQGSSHLAANYDQKEWLPLFKKAQDEEIENMTPGEALMTYDIMHNPIMEQLAIAHASDAMAFANDVMLNFSMAIDQKQNSFIANLTAAELENMGDDADDEDLTPAQRARKRIADTERRMREIGNDLHEERMEEQKESARKEWDAQMHNVAGLQISGAQLHAMWEYLQDPANAQAFEQDLMDKYKVSKEEAEKRRKETQEYLDLLEKQRRGEQLSEAEKRRMQELDSRSWMKETMQDLKNAQEAAKSYGYINSIQQTNYKEGITNVKSIEDNKKFFQENAESVSKPTVQTTTVNPELTEHVELLEKSRLEKDLSEDEPQRKSALEQNPDVVKKIHVSTTTTEKRPQLFAVADNSAEDFGIPIIQAEPLKPEFVKAGNSTVPLDSTPKREQPKIYVAANTSGPQLDGAAF